MASQNFISIFDIDRRVALAQSIIFDIETSTTSVIKELVKANSNAIGSPQEFIYFPLLSVASHFMGPHTRVVINEDWQEPLILWNVVLADKGQKKSPALNRLLKPIQKIEEQLVSDRVQQQEDEEQEGEKFRPQIYIEHFSMEELHYTLKRNNGRIVGLYDEISLLYEQLDKYKNGNSDRKTMLSLINGSAWRRNFRTTHSVVEQTWFNIAGFVQPDVIVTLLNGNDYDGFCDRQIFVCPPERDLDYDELTKPPPSTPEMDDIFKSLDHVHRHENTKYTLSGAAHTEFVAYHDKLNETKRKQHRRDRDRKSILSKAKGQVVRLAAVNYALNQAIIKVKEPESSNQWSYEIPKEFMTMAINLMDYIMKQKFALGKPANKPCVDGTSTGANVDVEESSMDYHRIKRLLELEPPLTITKISQKHIQRRVDNKYRKEEAEILMADVVKLGFGVFQEEQYQSGKTKRTRPFSRKER